MLNTFKLYSTLSASMDTASAKAIAEAMSEMYDELRNTVTKTEFGELRDIVRELADAQKRTELRVEELAEAQKRTEARVEELAAAQKRTELRVEELAEAQKRTEIEVRKLAKGLDDTRNMVGGLSDTVGYGLEDKAIKGLPPVLDSDYGIKVTGRLVRKYVEHPDGRHDELNVFGEGVRDGKPLSILGEAKARLSKKHISDFLKLVDRLEKRGHLPADRFLFMVSYTALPETLRYAEAHSVTVIPSYLI